MIRVLSAELIGRMLACRLLQLLERHLADDPVIDIKAIAGVAAGNTRS